MDTEKLTREEQLLARKRAAVELGEFRCAVPGVCTAQWDTDSWVKWVDQTGAWNFRPYNREES